ncbi:Mycothiol-dependent maleylpyruvate isomerase metal-binding domain-containing protein [Frankia sp. AiPs1]|uniref:maleylpyruvate isomerase N-terminal domain-containing protein n=1 Tax=Frankia sp. AiPa1 TaxID=573492 RepID=UPI00202B38B2|nr:maleylpyruvate isomerase N-terminal domain-containing protein [Frankia sp. AiPa1]MCL9762267.1 maleylpyruvate isomerase N-terminal domain-containing protein [Frankia sp. AiPa1]
MTSIGRIFLDTAVSAAGLLRAPELTERWDSPSALAQFQVSGLAGHLAWQILAVPGRLGTATSHGEPITLLEHYTTAPWVGAPPQDELNVRLRAFGETTAAGGPGALADEVDAALAELRAILPGVRAGDVLTLGAVAPTLTIDDYLSTRVLELAVHADDLAVSLGVPTPALPQPATDLVLALLARVAARRHGPVAVLRALSRAERAPATISAF